MQIVRTLTWVVVTIVVVAFIAFNVGETTEVTIWPAVGDEKPIFFEWPVWFLTLASFILGLLPMWLMLRATRWRLNRRIQSLENSLRAAAAVTPAPLPESTPAPLAPEPETTETIIDQEKPNVP
jgi:formate hydrogenlyase subunit 3/multisubunit Na+/H+ antiporter MnhD subunit